MNKFSKPLCGAVCALAVAASALTPATALAEVNYNKAQTLYKTSKTDMPSYSSISVNYSKESEAIKKSTIKTSNKAVAELHYLGTSNSKEKYDYFDENIKDDSYNYFNSQIGVKLNKTGKSVISFKAGDKTYKSSITVKDYVNPMESLTISGVNSGKNLASKFNKQANINEKLKKDIKNGVVKVKAKKGWKIKRIHTSSSTTQLNYSLYTANDKGVSSATLQLGDVKAGDGMNARVQVEFSDSKGGTLSCFYYFN